MWYVRRSLVLAAFLSACLLLASSVPAEGNGGGKGQGGPAVGKGEPPFGKGAKGKGEPPFGKGDKGKGKGKGK